MAGTRAPNNRNSFVRAWRLFQARRIPFGFETPGAYSPVYMVGTDARMRSNTICKEGGKVVASPIPRCKWDRFIISDLLFTSCASRVGVIELKILLIHWNQYCFYCALPNFVLHACNDMTLSYFGVYLCLRLCSGRVCQVF